MWPSVTGLLTAFAKTADHAEMTRATMIPRLHKYNFVKTRATTDEMYVAAGFRCRASYRRPRKQAMEQSGLSVSVFDKGFWTTSRCKMVLSNMLGRKSRLIWTSCLKSPVLP